MNLPSPQEPQRRPVELPDAEIVSQSKLAPEHFHKDPASVEYMMHLGSSLGISPVAALSNIHVWKDQDGKIKSTLSAHLLAGLARAAGHTVHISATPMKAVATLIRGDITKEQVELWKLMDIDPKQYAVFTSVWDRDRATKAGLINKAVWQKNVTDMLANAAKRSVARLGASEVLLGLAVVMRRYGVELEGGIDYELAVVNAQYTADEIGAQTDDDEKPLKGLIDITKLSEPPKPDVPPQIQKYVDSTSAAGLNAEAHTIANNATLPVPERLKRLHMMFTALKETEKINEQVDAVDPSGDVRRMKLGNAISAYAQPLKNQ